MAGTQLGYECYCGSYEGLSDTEKVPDTLCNYNCPGDPGNTVKCGAFLTLTIHDLRGRPRFQTITPETKEYEYLGCYQEYVPRKFTKFVTGEPLQTPKTCLDACNAENLELAGIQISSQCWCGDPVDLIEMEKLDDRQCTYKCAGDQSQACGGWMIASVYAKPRFLPVATTTFRPFTFEIDSDVQRRCKSSRMDLLFVVDGGSSIGGKNFETIKQFLKDAVDLVDISNRNTKIGLIQFNDNPYTEFHFNRFLNEETLKLG